MSMQVAVEQRDGYTLVRISGSPSIGQFVSFITLLSVESASWPQPRGMFDLRGIDTLKAVTDHVAIGKAVAEHLDHLEKLASLVPADRATGISRKVAQEAGVNLGVFVDEAEAIRWLSAER
jgi:hypothetical protein